MKKRRSAPRRPDQVAESIRQVLAAALLRGEIRDPRVGMVTITSVTVTPDLGTARVWVALPGEPDEQARALEGLRSAARYLRGLVAQALTTYTAPELRFERDDGAERGARVDAILAELKRTEARDAREAEGAEDARGAQEGPEADNAQDRDG